MLMKQKPPSEYVGAVISATLLAMATEYTTKNKEYGLITVMLIGPPGTGKTYQLWAIQQSLVSGDEFANTHKCHVISECEHIDAYRYDNDNLKQYCEFTGTLAVDDIGYKKPTDWNIQAIYNIANYRRRNLLKTVWTTNLTREQLKELYGAPIASRLLGGLVVETGGVDRRLV